MKSKKTPRLGALIVLPILIQLVTYQLHAGPGTISHQGYVEVDGVPFNGSGQFKFALVNAASDQTYWSNDGTSNAGAEPTAAVSLTVSGGLFNIALGDDSIANMTALPASVFVDNDDVTLRVWFNDGTNGSQQLTPDRKVASVGFAMAASTVPDEAITEAKMADGAITSTKLALK